MPNGDSNIADKAKPINKEYAKNVYDYLRTNPDVQMKLGYDDFVGKYLNENEVGNTLLKVQQLSSIRPFQGGGIDSYESFTGKVFNPNQQEEPIVSGEESSDLLEQQGVSENWYEAINDAQDYSAPETTKGELVQADESHPSKQVVPPEEAEEGELPWLDAFEEMEAKKQELRNSIPKTSKMLREYVIPDEEYDYVAMEDFKVGAKLFPKGTKVNAHEQEDGSIKYQIYHPDSDGTDEYHQKNLRVDAASDRWDDSLIGTSLLTPQEADEAQSDDLNYVNLKQTLEEYKQAIPDEWDEWQKQVRNERVLSENVVMPDPFKDELEPNVLALMDATTTAFTEEQKKYIQAEKFRAKREALESTIDQRWVQDYMALTGDNPVEKGVSMKQAVEMLITVDPDYTINTSFEGLTMETADEWDYVRQRNPEKFKKQQELARKYVDEVIGGDSKDEIVSEVSKKQGELAKLLSETDGFGYGEEEIATWGDWELWGEVLEKKGYSDLSEKDIEALSKMQYNRFLDVAERKYGLSRDVEDMMVKYSIDMSSKEGYANAKRRALLERISTGLGLLTEPEREIFNLMSKKSDLETQLYRGENLTTGQQADYLRQIKEYESKINNLKSSPRQLYNPLSGEYVDMGGADADSFTMNYNKAVSKYEAKYAGTDVGKMTKVYNDLVTQYRYLSDAVHAPKTIITNPKMKEYLPFGAGEYKGAVKKSSWDVVRGFEAGDIFMEPQDKAYHQSLVKKYIDTKAKLHAVSKALLLNEDPAGIERSGWEIFGENVVEGFLQSPELAKDIIVTDSQFATEFVDAMQRGGGELTQGQKKAAEDNLSQKAAAAAGQSIGIMADIAIGAAITKQLPIGSLLRGVRVMSARRYGKAGKFFYNTIEAGIKGDVISRVALREEVTAPMMIGESLTEKWIDGMNMGKILRNKYMKFLLPFGKTIREYGIRVGAGTVSETIAEYTGEYLDLLDKNGYDYNDAFVRTFGRNVEDGIDKLMVVALTSSMFSGTFNLFAVKGIRNQLAIEKREAINKGRRELIEKIEAYEKQLDERIDDMSKSPENKSVEMRRDEVRKEVDELNGLIEDAEEIVASKEEGTQEHTQATSNLNELNNKKQALESELSDLDKKPEQEPTDDVPLSRKEEMMAAKIKQIKGEELTEEEKQLADEYDGIKNKKKEDEGEEITDDELVPEPEVEAAGLTKGETYTNTKQNKQYVYEGTTEKGRHIMRDSETGERRYFTKTNVFESAEVEAETAKVETEPAPEPTTTEPVVDEDNKLKERGFTDSQIKRANPEAKKRIIEGDLEPQQVSILPNGNISIITPKQEAEPTQKEEVKAEPKKKKEEAPPSPKQEVEARQYDEQEQKVIDTAKKLKSAKKSKKGVDAARKAQGRAVEDLMRGMRPEQIDEVKDILKITPQTDSPQGMLNAALATGKTPEQFVDAIDEARFGGRGLEQVKAKAKEKQEAEQRREEAKEKAKKDATKVLTKGDKERMAEKKKAKESKVTPKGKADIKKAMKSVFGLSDKQADAVSKAYDAVARAWAKRNNKKPSDWYKRIKGIEKAKIDDLVGKILKQLSLKHGSPYQFEKFSLRAVGQGEGFQAFGHGLYFTGVKDIAESYAMLPKQNILKAGGKSVDVSTTELKAAMSIIMEGVMTMATLSKESYTPSKNVPLGEALGNTLKRIDELHREGESSLVDYFNNILTGYHKTKVELALQEVAEYEQFFGEQLTADLLETPTVYDVTIHKGKKPTEYRYESWYDKLSDDVTSIFKKIAQDNGVAAQWYLDMLEEGTTLERAYLGLASAMSGADGMVWESSEDMRDQFDNEPEAMPIENSSIAPFNKYAPVISKALLDNGVDGIVYPSQSFGGNRNLRDGENNYVVFDDGAITIEDAVRLQEDEVARAAIKLLADGNFYLYALTDPNVSSPLHELAHIFEGDLEPQQIKDVLEWSGQDKWDTDTSEKFARAFETYLKEGKAPTTKLGEIFEQFKSWLKDIYASSIVYKGEPIVLNDKMRSVFDEVLGAEPEVKVEQKAKPKKKKAKKKEKAPSKQRKEGQDLVRAKEAKEGDALTEDGAALINMMVEDLGAANHPFSDTAKSVVPKLTQAINNLAAGKITADTAVIPLGGEILSINQVMKSSRFMGKANGNITGDATKLRNEIAKALVNAKKTAEAKKAEQDEAIRDAEEMIERGLKEMEAAAQMSLSTATAGLNPKAAIKLLAGMSDVAWGLAIKAEDKFTDFIEAIGKKLFSALEKALKPLGYSVRKFWDIARKTAKQVQQKYTKYQDARVRATSSVLNANEAVDYRDALANLWSKHKTNPEEFVREVRKAAILYTNAANTFKGKEAEFYGNVSKAFWDLNKHLEQLTEDYDLMEAMIEIETNPNHAKFNSDGLNEEVDMRDAKLYDTGQNVKNFVKDLIYARFGEIKTYEIIQGKKANQMKREMPRKAEREALTLYMQGIRKVPSKWKEDAPHQRRVQKYLDNPTEAMKRWAKDLRQEFDTAHDRLIDLWGEDTGYIQDYVPQLWEFPSKKRANNFVKMFSTQNPNVKKRFFRNYAEGIESGLQPKTLDASTLLMIYSNNLIKTEANKKFVDAIFDMVDEHGRPLVVPVSDISKFDGYKKIDNPSFKKIKFKSKTKDGATILSNEPIAAHPDVFRMIAAVSDAGLKAHSVGTYFSPLLMFNAMLKKSQLSISLFHHMALTETGTVTPRSFFRALGMLRPTAVMNAMLNGEFEVFTNLKISTDAVQHGLELGAIADAQRDLVQNTLDQLADRVERLGFLNKKIPHIGKVNPMRGLAKFNDKWDSALWDYLHNGLKLKAYETLSAQHIKANPNTDPTKIKREVAQFVNDTYGGQVWELLGVSKSQKDLLQLLFLSPDWTVSTGRQALSLFTGFMGDAKWKEGEKSKFERVLGSLDTANNPETAHIRRKIGWGFWARVLVIYYGAMNVFNHVLTKGDCEEKNRTGKPCEGSFMWENPEGEKTNLFIGRRADGTKNYLRWGKQFKEAPEMMEKPQAKLGGKLAPWAQLSSVLFTDKTLSGFEVKKKSGEKYTFYEKIAKSFTPFMVSQLERSEELTGVQKALTTAFPQRKGRSYFKSKEFMKEALIEGDDSKLIEEYIEAVDNELEASKILEDAMDDVLGEKRSELKRRYRVGSVEKLPTEGRKEYNELKLDWKKKIGKIKKNVAKGVEDITSIDVVFKERKRNRRGKILKKPRTLSKAKVER